ncbi:phospholipase D family protein [Lachnospiraceae bacterium OttesenSCG-928-E19]|nr:phospholipase D family protein [Lachnospiraceae bacterium OttesenSCG-928-E19]
MKMKFTLFFVLNFLMGCASVPVSMQDTKSVYTPKITTADFNYDPYKTDIAKIYNHELKDKKISGAALIDDGVAAFVIRAAFARMATKTIDLQTYIYSNDFSSRILIAELKSAADRGVKVRILLDDYGTNSDLVDVMLLNNHPNIEVKVFNVFKYRNRLIHYPQFVFDFNRLNSRMHNKLFIVDNISVITGGRNIGSNYFYPETSSNFSDTDVLFIGNMASQSAKHFDQYWNYHRSIPASLFPSTKSKKRMRKLDEHFAQIQKQARKDVAAYNSIINETLNEYKDKKFDIYWGNGLMLSDAPEKVEMSRKEKKDHENVIVRALNKLWRDTKESVYISAAYFVPGKEGVHDIISEEKKGVPVTVVTNSLSSTNAPTVYAKWEKYRSGLIESGVEVYEFMKAAENNRGKDHDVIKKRSSFSVLHSKTIVFDDKYSWIGSFNLDPRSALYNTENVAIFDNPDFAVELRNMIIKDTQTSWHVTREHGKTYWRGKRPKDANVKTYTNSPDTTWLWRVWTWITKVVPESLV